MKILLLSRLEKPFFSFFILQQLRKNIMNKKQRNRKTIAQNKRNRMINRRYLSTIKTLFKLFLLGKEKTEKTPFVSKLNSIIDKAIKKKVIHKNTGARKKSRILSLYKDS